VNLGRLLFLTAAHVSIQQDGALSKVGTVRLLILALHGIVYYLRSLVEAHAEALQVEGAHLFDSRSTGQPLRAWVQVPQAHSSTWGHFATLACKTVAGAAQAQKDAIIRGLLEARSKILTLADQQRDYFFGVLRERFPDLLPLYERMYPHPTASYGGIRTGDPHAIGRRIHELCGQYGIFDRLPRSIIPGNKRALNKRVVEALANECYWMELDNAPQRRVWVYRKAAWAIEDTEQDIGLIYRAMGRKGLESIENVEPRMAEVVEGLINDLSGIQMCATM